MVRASIIRVCPVSSLCTVRTSATRLWSSNGSGRTTRRFLMHRNVTHNKCYATCAQFADATLSFLRGKVPGNWADLCDLVTDNFRVINPKDFRVMT